MDKFIDIIEDLRGYINSSARIDTHLFKSEGTNIQCVIIISDFEPAGPVKHGKDIQIDMQVRGSFKNWKQILQKLGRIDDILENRITGEDTDIKLKLRCDIGIWSLIDDESDLIYQNRLTIRCVRLDT